MIYADKLGYCDEVNEVVKIALDKLHDLRNYVSTEDYLEFLYQSTIETAQDIGLFNVEYNYIKQYINAHYKNL